MSHNKQPVEDMLDAAAPQGLTDAERSALWSAVEARMSAPRTVASPYFSWETFTPKSMIPLIIAIAVLLGAGGTVAASDAARPGDLLFPVDRAVEDVRLALASDAEKSELRLRFADERLGEFSSVVDEELGNDDLSGELTEAEADIFTNETLVKLEAGDRKAYFSTQADTREEIIEVIASRYGFSEADIDAVLSIETEDRASRAEDGPTVSSDARLRIEHALSVLNEFVLDTRGNASTSIAVLTALSVLEDKLLERSGGLPEEIRARVRDDRARFEIEDENGRVRVEVKNGEVRVKTKDDSDDDDSDDRSSRDDSDDSSDDGLEIEADVFTDTTLIKVELNDDKDTFSTSATSRTAIIAAIATRYPSLSLTEIDAALDLEIEDRASRAEDSDDDEDESDDDSEDDDSDDDDNSGHGGEDDDEDEDDDNSGHGGGND